MSWHSKPPMNLFLLSAPSVEPVDLVVCDGNTILCNRLVNRLDGTTWQLMTADQKPLQIQ
jgi:hypothetical protein